jgi:anti-sigma-K factor RskA
MKHDLHTLAAAYAMDAVSGTERRRFERHLTGCPTCAQEVRELEETAARLAVAAAQPPPATLRERVLTQTARARQLPPRLSERRLGSKARGMNRILAAACLILALIAGVTAVGSQHRAQRAEALNRQITAIMAAPDAHTVVGQARPSGTATILMSRSLDKAVIVASGLRTLSGAKTYQLWLMGAGPPRPAGILGPSAGRPSRPVLAGPVGAARQIGLTIEPAGGSPRPTSPPILIAPLS